MAKAKAKAKLKVEVEMEAENGDKQMNPARPIAWATLPSQTTTTTTRQKGARSLHKYTSISALTHTYKRARFVWCVGLVSTHIVSYDNNNNNNDSPSQEPVSGGGASLALPGGCKNITHIF